jgi:Icc-related predicted phosphoesterase
MSTVNIRLFSDLHNEFNVFDPPRLSTDRDDVLVLAGDIGVADAKQTIAPIAEWAKRFRHVVYVCGNHEYYHGSLVRVRRKLQDQLGNASNVTVAENEVVRIDDVSFICGTLWTDYDKGNPLARYEVQRQLNDYRMIRTGTPGLPYKRRITTDDIVSKHFETKSFIFDAITKEKASGQKTVVVTHHGPTTLSIHPMYANDILNWAYVSDLSNEILDTQPTLWVHGHTHHNFNYKMGDTVIRTNPRGYHHPLGQPENRGFNPELRLAV